jgi:hypothetical protein
LALIAPTPIALKKRQGRIRSNLVSRFLSRKTIQLLNYRWLLRRVEAVDKERGHLPALGLRMLQAVLIARKRYGPIWIAGIVYLDYHGPVVTHFAAQS